MAPVTEGNDLARLLAEARGDLPMREVARRSGLSAAQISRIEGGGVDAPTVETLTKIALALDRDPELLLIAIGRVEGSTAYGRVFQALGAADIDSLTQLRDQLAERMQRLGALEQVRAQTQGEYQALAGRHDFLNHEASELYHEAEYFHRAAAETDDLLDQPGAGEEYRERARGAEKQFGEMQADIKALKRQGSVVRKQLEKHEMAVRDERAKLAQTAQHAAGRLFVEKRGSPISELLVLDEMNRWAGSPEPTTAVLQRHMSNWASEPNEPAATSDPVDLAELNKRMDEMRRDLARELGTLRSRIAHRTGDPEFRRLAAAWYRLTPERRERVLDFVEDQRRLSLQEQLERKEVVAIEQAGSSKKQS